MKELATNTLELMNKMDISEKESQMFIKNGDFSLDIFLDECVKRGIVSDAELVEIEKTMNPNSRL